MHRYGITEDKYLGRKSLVALMITGLLTVGGSVPMVLAETGEEAPVETTVEGESQAETEVLAEATPQADIAESGITTTIEKDTLYVRGNGILESLSLSSSQTRSVKHIVIEEGITSIADTSGGVFGSMSYGQVESIQLPNSLTYIGKSAFHNMDQVTELVIPDNVTAIGESAFRGCKELASLHLGTGLHTIGDSAFDCFAATNQSLTELDLQNVTSVGKDAFRHFSAVQTLKAPKLTTIGEYAFANQSALTTATMPNVTTVGNRAFSECTSLTVVNIPNVKTIGDAAFYNCKSISSMSIDNVETLGDNALAKCDKIESLTFNCLKTASDSSLPKDGALTTIEFKGDAPDVWRLIPKDAKVIFPAGNDTWTVAARMNLIDYSGNANNMFVRQADGSLVQADYASSGERTNLNLGEKQTAYFNDNYKKTFVFSVPRKMRTQLDFSFYHGTNKYHIFSVEMKNNKGEMVLDRNFDKFNSNTFDSKTISMDLEPGTYYLEISSVLDSGYESMSVTVSDYVNIPKSMYRLYNPNSGEHFYTASSAERNSLVQSGWKYEGIGWTAPTSSSTPVYRLYSGTDHHYTTSKTERDQLRRAGWKYEGIGWYSDDAKGVPLYRQFNPNVNPRSYRNNSGSHNYTTSLSEHNNLVRGGWKGEGVAWYGMK